MLFANVAAAMFAPQNTPVTEFEVLSETVLNSNRQVDALFVELNSTPPNVGINIMGSLPGPPLETMKLLVMSKLPPKIKIPPPPFSLIVLCVTVSTPAPEKIPIPGLLSILARVKVNLGLPVPNNDTAGSVLAPIPIAISRS
jgi:hypothetical protein